MCAGECDGGVEDDSSVAETIEGKVGNESNVAETSGASP